MNSADPVNTIRIEVLTRRWQQVGDIVKTGRGTWALKEWTQSTSRDRRPKMAILGEVEGENDNSGNAPS